MPAGPAGIGLAAYEHLVPIAIVVVVLLVIVVDQLPPDDLRLPDAAAAPTSCQPREPRRDPVARRRRVAARRLHPHRRRVGRRRRARHPLGRSASTSSWRVPLCLVAHRRDDGRQPARAEGVGRAVRPADLRLRRPARACSSSSACTGSSCGPRPDPADQLPRRRSELAEGTARSACSSSCGRSRPGAVALSGVEAISNGVPAFRKPESPNAATTLVVDGRHPRHRASSASRCSPRTSSRSAARRARPARADGRARLRRQERAVLRHPVRHVRDPDPRRQHRVRRLPAAVVDHRPRRLPAAPARQPRRPARVLQRRSSSSPCWPAS